MAMGPAIDFDVMPRSPHALSAVELETFVKLVTDERLNEDDSTDEYGSDGTSIAGGDVELPIGVGQAWRGARKAAQRYDHKYMEAEVRIRLLGSVIPR
ncbi:hypothetical protein FLAG1_09590 [Fusarium langsethiae]|uniref:Uncharacterized protein n=1 Tax=Fusarium langsethiae TaxID=179993 RepID=A0A0N0V5B6_FUSLA|nr:hypothetical protein FLAG1_09590 [Fusarium langsethiae]